MRYRMKQKMICFGNDFAVHDEQGKLAYFIDGKAFTFGEKLSFQDAHKKELAFISQKLMAFVKTFSISQNGEVVAVVKKRPLTIRDCFKIELPKTRETLEIVGNLLFYDYVIKRGRDVVAEVSKKWFTFTDSYGVEIKDSRDTVLLLAATVVIDLVLHNEEK